MYAYVPAGTIRIFVNIGKNTMALFIQRKKKETIFRS